MLTFFSFSFTVFLFCLFPFFSCFLDYFLPSFTPVQSFLFPFPFLLLHHPSAVPGNAGVLLFLPSEGFFFLTCSIFFSTLFFIFPFRFSLPFLLISSVLLFSPFSLFPFVSPYLICFCLFPFLSLYSIPSTTYSIALSSIR